MTGLTLWRRVYPWLRNKYVLTLLIFVLWMLLFDASSWLKVIGQSRQNRQMEREREYYIERIAHDQTRLQELRTCDENLEKFAREQYLMKRPNEVIYIIEEP